jgi:hypothetical protein
MANTSNVAAGKPKIGGAVSIAATTATLPTDATTALSGFTNLGYISEDGLTQTITRDSEAIKAWGGDTVMTTQTDFGEEFSFTLLEVLSVDVKKAIYGDDAVTGDLTTGITARVNSAELTAHAWIFDMVQNGATVRIVIPNGKVSEVGEITYQDGEPIGYELTVTALPDASGNCSYEYTVKA